MKKLVSLLLICILCFLAVNGFAGGFCNDGDAIEKAAKSVLKLYVYEDLNDEDYSGTGSGFVAFNSSTLITNYHVIENAVIIIASDDDDNVYAIDKVLCADKKSDMADYADS